MSSHTERAFIQARMSSTRYPGKALAPLTGKPLIDRVVDRVGQVFDRDDIVLLTSTHPTDDPLAQYADTSIEVYCGDLANVFQRYQGALAEYPCDRFFRVCGDSPFLEPTLFERAIDLADQHSFDLLTTKLDGSLPLGKNVECLNSSTFQSIDAGNLSTKEQEHICNIFYDNPDQYTLHPISTPDLSVEHSGFCVDVVEDIKRLSEQEENDQLEEHRFKYPFDVC